MRYVPRVPVRFSDTPWVSFCALVSTLVAALTALCLTPAHAQAPAFLVKDINPRAPLTTPSILELTSVNGLLLFAADDGQSGSELWRSDGTEAGTVLVRDINPGTEPSSPTALHAFEGTVLFRAEDAAHGVELWRSDGTSAGTDLVADIRPGVNGSFPTDLVALGEYILFFASSDADGRELWRTDGTPAGTTMVTDLPPAGYFPLPIFPTTVGGQVFFESGGDQLWRSDGTAGGTEVVMDFQPSEIIGFGAGDGVLFIAVWRNTCPSADCEIGLWKSDGNAAGTTMIATFPTNGRDIASMEFTALDDLVYFIPVFKRLAFGVHRSGLWRSDGTPEGTFAIEASTTTVTAFAPFDGALFYGAIREGGGLLRTEGASSGTSVISGIQPVHLTDVAGHLLFEGCGGTACALWESDGTSVGTRRLADVDPHLLSIDPSAPFTRAGSHIFFTSSDNTELWAVPVSSLGLCGNAVVDAGETCDTGHETATCAADCTPAAFCVGDCDSDRMVAISELVAMVNGALSGDAALCLAGDSSFDGTITIDEIIAALGHALEGCGAV